MSNQNLSDQLVALSAHHRSRADQLSELAKALTDRGLDADLGLDEKWSLPEQLANLAEAITDQELDDEQQRRVLSAAHGEGLRIVSEREIEKTAHIHNVAHAADKGNHLCHDCGRELISDIGLERILVCPQVHGRRPPGLKPTHADGVVECGLKA